MRKQEATNASKDTPHLQESGGRFAPGYKMSKQSLKSARQLKACMMQKMTAPPYEQATMPNGHLVTMMLHACTLFLLAPSDE